MGKDYEKNKTVRDRSDDEQKSDTSEDIKKGMDRYEARIKSPTKGGGGEAQPAGDSTKSEE
jgi:hypothetical protein